MNPRRFFFEKCSILDRLFAVLHCRRAPRGDFLDAEKVTKDAHRERGFRSPPLPMYPHPQQPKWASAPFGNPLGVVRCLTLPIFFSADVERSVKTTLVSRSFALPWRESKGNRARFLFGGSRVEVFRRRGKRNPRLLNDSLVTFCSHRKSPRGATGSETLRKFYLELPAPSPWCSAFSASPQPNIPKLCKICYLRLIENCCVWLHNSYK